MRATCGRLASRFTFCTLFCKQIAPAELATRTKSCRLLARRTESCRVLASRSKSCRLFAKKWSKVLQAARMFFWRAYPVKCSTPTNSDPFARIWPGLCTQLGSGSASVPSCTLDLLSHWPVSREKRQGMLLGESKVYSTDGCGKTMQSSRHKGARGRGLTRLRKNTS